MLSQHRQPHNLSSGTSTVECPHHYLFEISYRLIHCLGTPALCRTGVPVRQVTSKGGPHSLLASCVRSHLGQIQEIKKINPYEYPYRGSISTLPSFPIVCVERVYDGVDIGPISGKKMPHLPLLHLGLSTDPTGMPSKLARRGTVHDRRKSQWRSDTGIENRTCT